MVEKLAKRYGKANLVSWVPNKCILCSFDGSLDTTVDEYGRAMYLCKSCADTVNSIIVGGKLG